MKKDKIQEISAWDGTGSTWPESRERRYRRSVTRHGSGQRPLGRPVRGWPSSGPQSCVMYVPDVLSTCKRLPRNQELWTNSLEAPEGQGVVAAEFPVRECDPGCPGRPKIHRNFSFCFPGQPSWTLWS